MDDTAGPVRRRLPARTLWTWAPLIAALAACLLSWPQRLNFNEFLTDDAGTSLAATLMAARGDFHFGFPYGPLTLALQQASIRLAGSGPRGFAWLTLFADLAAAAALSLLIRRLRLGRVAALLLTLAAALPALPVIKAPVYDLEPALLLWALVAWVLEWPACAFALCAAGALIKPSMALVLGAWLLAGEAWQARRNHRWRPCLGALGRAALAAAALIGGLLWWYGGHEFFTLLSPAAGMRNHRALGFSFFVRTDNPFVLPWLAHLHLLRYYFGTPLALWTAACLLLCAVVCLPLLRDGPLQADAAGPYEARRTFVAQGCLVGAALFVVAFYGWPFSFNEYLYLPLLGLALAPAVGAPSASRPARRWPAWAPGIVVCLGCLGAWGSVHADLSAWRQERPRAVTAGLWATAADANAMAAFIAANPPATHPLDLMRAPLETLFPAYGAVWHGYASPGEITPAESQQIERRLAASRCVAIAPGPVALTPAQWRAIEARGPRARVGTLFDTYGCQPAR